MVDPKKDKKEQDWADRTAESEDQDGEAEKTYRDGSAVNECWDYKDY